MKATYLLPLLFTVGAAQASLIEDSRAFSACQDRFNSTNHRQEMGLRAGPVYTNEGARGEYLYYFNASNAEGNYRVACQAQRRGKVLDFGIEEGKWAYQGKRQAQLVAN
jgi:hypothetical protein